MKIYLNMVCFAISNYIFVLKFLDVIQITNKIHYLDLSLKFQIFWCSDAYFIKLVKQSELHILVMKLNTYIHVYVKFDLL